MLRSEVKRANGKLRVTILGPRPWPRSGEQILHTTAKVNATARDEQAARRALERLGIPVSDPAKG